MNLIFISPNFPQNFCHFCDRLNDNGVNVLGIGDCPYDDLSEELKYSLTEYFKVDSLEDYDQVFRAVAFFSFKEVKKRGKKNDRRIFLPRPLLHRKGRQYP